MKPELIWLAVLVLIAACATPPRATFVHAPRSTVQAPAVVPLEPPAIHGDATDDLVSDQGQRIPAQPEGARVFVNGVEAR